MKLIDILKSTSEFTRNVATIATGTIMVQIISFGFSIILARIYLPADYGIVASFTAIQSLILVFVTMQYSSAIMVAKTNNDAKAVLQGCIVISIIIASFTAIGCILYGILLGGEITIKIFLLLLPLQVIVTSVTDSVTVWINRSKQYKNLSRIMVIYSVLNSLLCILFGLLSWGAVGLLLGQFLSALINCIMLIWVMLKYSDYREHTVTNSNIKSQLIIHKKFPMFNIMSQFLNTASTQVPVLMFSSFYGDQSTGNYSRAKNYSSIPMEVFGKSVGTVFYQEASALNNSGDYDKLKAFTYSTYKKLIFLAACPMALLFGFGDIIFTFVLGKNWLQAGQCAQILSPWIVMMFITNPLMTLLYIKNKQENNTIINIILFISRVLVVGICVYMGADFFFCMIAFSATGTIIWLGINSYILKQVGIGFFQSTAICFLITAFFFVISLAVRLILI